jgi:hypothetical protein
VKHFAVSRFWQGYNSLPRETQKQADKQFALLKSNPRHPSLHFKKTGRYWSASVSSSIRALAVEKDGALVWFWIGSHREYEKLIG